MGDAGYIIKYIIFKKISKINKIKYKFHIQERSTMNQNIQISFTFIYINSEKLIDLFLLKSVATERGTWWTITLPTEPPSLC